MTGILQIFTRAVESVKIGTLIRSFCPSRKCVSFKFTVGSCVLTMKNDTKIEDELTCCFKIDMNFTKFDPSTQKVKKSFF